MENSLPRDIPALDGLRGAAALIVLISHSANAGLIPKFLGIGFGQVGVAVFYALSGFLMAHVNFGKVLSRTSLRSYGVARGSRVLPMFYAVVGANTLAFLILGSALYEASAWPDFLYALFMVQGTSVLWSIPVEIHFYVLFLAIWWAADRKMLWPALLALTALGVVASVAIISQTGDDRWLPVWLHFFLLGIAVRHLLGTGGRLALPWRNPSRGLVMAAWGVFLAAALLPPQIRVSAGYPALPVYADPFVIVMVALILWFACLPKGPFQLLCNPLLVWYGHISFSLYLLHRPIIQQIRNLGIGAGIPFAGFAIVVVLATLAAWICREQIEVRAQAWLRRKFR